MDGQGCNWLTGRFLISELTFGSDRKLQNLAIDFEQHCIDPTQYFCPDVVCPALYGSIRYNSDVSLTPKVSVADQTVLKGNAGTNDGGVILSLSMPSTTPITARFQTIDDTAVQGSDYVATAGEVVFPPGSTEQAINVPILGNRAATGNKSFSVELLPDESSIGDGAARVTILDPNVPMTILAMNSLQGDYIGQGLTWLETTKDTAFTLSRNSEQGITITSDNFAAPPLLQPMMDGLWTIAMAAPRDAALGLGSYEHAQRYPFNRPALPGLNASGSGRDCGNLRGRFDINEVDYAKDGTPDRLSVDFEQICDERFTKPLFGAFRLNATLRQASVTNATIHRHYAVFTVTLNPADSLAHSVTFTTYDGTAQTGVDYDQVVRRITFKPGEISKEVRVPLLSGAHSGTNFFAVLTASSTPLWVNVGSATIE